MQIFKRSSLNDGKEGKEKMADLLEVHFTADHTQRHYRGISTDDPIFGRWKLYIHGLGQKPGKPAFLNC